MENKYLVITNNPTVREKYEDKMETLFVDGVYLDVLIAVRNKIHLGFRLITHPLMGSVKPNETPYRSIILQYGSSTDIQSVNIIENSIYNCEKFLKDKATPNWAESILEDFRFVDMKLFESAYSSIG